ncbi:MAG: hypothetical protein AB1705_16390 [Verrucomicrobiota bacterium]
MNRPVEVLSNHFMPAVAVRWIADRLHMGSTGYAQHLLYKQRRAATK